MGKFSGSLNSRRRNGNPYFGYQDEHRFRKYVKIQDLLKYNPHSWYHGKYWRYSKDKTFPCWFGQKFDSGNIRQYNHDTTNKKLWLFPWRI